MPAGLYTRTPEIRAKNRAASLGHKASAETKAKMSAARMGMLRPKSPEWRTKIAVSMRESMLTHMGTVPGCRCIGCNPVQVIASPTSLEKKLLTVFLAEFPEVIPERQFGPYKVDAYLPPPYHLAFEADGEYWHQHVEERDPGHDQRRDAYLLEKHGLPVIRLTGGDLQCR